ncbi:hypothetical protein BDW02DRAFT_84384 [Decorospora gaudefroyi]|uniref:Zn(2)-C6 fungal-type domain-containing protein n=1 Tax=Decorospora gaudefroyi TaxID=184978 RepID=A0A6A5KRN6_9PLEO|nr:hypothetical protein BDW02DRAFT_84384 [Decorospora gaudefroyi]
MGKTQVRRACDRCHAVKEKCRWMPDQNACERCHRLQSRCQSLRPVATAGRKPRYQRGESAIRRPTHALPIVPRADVPSPPRTLSLLPGLGEREMQLLRNTFQGQPRINQFLIGPTFSIGHHKTFARHLYRATPYIQDGVLAMSAILACEHEDQPILEDRTIGHKRAASAVSTLRSMSTFGSGDLSTVLLLAISAVTFALHANGNALAICRHSLHVIKPLYESSMELDAECLAFLICLIHTETVECLLRCEIPTLRFKVQIPEGFVDRYMGIASPMLPYLHDVCCLSYAMCHSDRVGWTELMRAMDAIESAVEQWTPSLPEGCATRFLEEEVISIYGQARVYRWSVLLLIHRLRHPYGTETAKGAAISEAILRELDLIVRRTKRSVPCVTIAFTFACFELNDSAKRQMALDSTTILIEFSKQIQINIKKQLAAFWSVKDTRDQLHWCDMISWLPP